MTAPVTTPLATVTDLATYLQRPLTESETDKAELLLDGFSEAIRRDTGQVFTESTSTVELPGTGARWLVLPQQPVTEVTDVRLGDAEVPDWRLRNGRLVLDRGAWASSEYFEVTFTHGYADVPEDVVAFIVMACEEALKGNVPLQREQVGPFTRSFLESPPGEHIALGHSNLVRRYRINSVGMVRVG